MIRANTSATAKRQLFKVNIKLVYNFVYKRKVYLPAIPNQMYKPNTLAYKSIGFVNMLSTVKPQPITLKSKAIAKNAIVDIHIPALMKLSEPEILQCCVKII